MTWKASEEAARDELTVAAELKAVLEEAGVSLREVDRRVGWALGSCAQVLRVRRERLRLDHVFSILRAVGVQPEAFFLRLHDALARRAA